MNLTNVPNFRVANTNHSYDSLLNYYWLIPSFFFSINSVCTYINHTTNGNWGFTEQNCMWKKGNSVLNELFDPVVIWSCWAIAILWKWLPNLYNHPISDEYRRDPRIKMLIHLFIPVVKAKNKAKMLRINSKYWRLKVTTMLLKCKIWLLPLCIWTQRAGLPSLRHA